MLHLKNCKKHPVISADVNTLPDAINVIVTGEGFTNFMQLKTIWRSISWNIQMNFIRTSNCLIWLHELLVRMLLWVKVVFVELPYHKTLKISEILQKV